MRCAEADIPPEFTRFEDESTLRFLDSFVLLDEKGKMVPLELLDAGGGPLYAEGELLVPPKIVGRKKAKSGKGKAAKKVGGASSLLMRK